MNYIILDAEFSIHKGWIITKLIIDDELYEFDNSYYLLYITDFVKNITKFLKTQDISIDNYKLITNVKYNQDDCYLGLLLKNHIDNF